MSLAGALSGCLSGNLARSRFASIPVAAPAAQGWYGVCRDESAGIWCAVSYDGATQRAATSSDGQAWTMRDLAASGDWVRVRWSDTLDQLCAVAATGVNRVATSDDHGVTWDLRTPSSAAAWYGVCWAGGLGKWVSVAQGTASMLSVDGVTWTAGGALPSSKAWNHVEWLDSAGVLVAIADNGGGAMAYSADGSSWIAATPPAASKAWSALVPSTRLGKFVSLAASAGPNNAGLSSDGINWTSGTHGGYVAGFGPYAIVDTGSILVAVNAEGQDRLLYSSNGVSWERQATSPADQWWEDVAWSAVEGYGIAVSDGGDGADTYRFTKIVPA